MKLVIDEASMKKKYYHGSSVKMKIGSVIVAKEKQTEFSSRISKDGINVEQFVESMRPSTEVSRLKCIYVVDDLTMLNIAGASEDYVYEVQPIGNITPAHFGWFTRVLSAAKNYLEENPIAEKSAMKYWNNEPYSQKLGWSNAAQEYLCESVKIVKLVK